MSGKGTPFGAFLDSTLDRDRGGHRAHRGRRARSPTTATSFAVAAVVVAVLASLMVSYTRARAEALGVECKVGIANRAVRVVILVDRAALLADLGRARARGLRARRTEHRHRPPAHLPRAPRALARRVTRPRRERGLSLPDRESTREHMSTNGKTNGHAAQRERPPAGQGPRRHHRRRQLRHRLRAGRRVLQERRRRAGRPRPHARRPRRLPRPRHRVLGRVRHRRREGRQGPRRGDLGRPEQHDQVRRRSASSACRSTAA